MDGKMPKIHTRFDPPVSKGLKCEDASLTRQEFLKEADLNNIMKRYAAGMPLPSGSRPPLFDDFSNIPDFQTSFDLVERSSDLFMQLPSEVRKRFDNDPCKLLGFLQDTNNREEAIKLGLIDKPAKTAEKSVENVSVPDNKEGAE